MQYALQLLIVLKLSCSIGNIKYKQNCYNRQVTYKMPIPEVEEIFLKYKREENRVEELLKNNQ